MKLVEFAVLIVLFVVLSVQVAHFFVLLAMLIVVLVFLVEVDFVVVDNYEVLILVELILVLSLLDRAGIG